MIADKAPPAVVVQDAMALARSGLKVVALAWAVMLAFWPYAAIDPLRHPFDVLQTLAHFPDYYGTVRFEGADLAPTQLPWTYVPVWFGVTLPEFYFVAAAAAIWQTPAWLAALRQQDVDRGRAVLTFALIAVILLPVLSAIVLGATLYDGIRHFLFIVPPLAIAAALAIASLVTSTRSRAVRAGVAVVVGVSLIAAASDMFRLHPYESVYFNRTFGGGLAAAAPRFDTDYWGQSYREGVEWLMANYGSGAGEPIRVANCSKEFLTGYYIETSPTARGRFVSVPIEQHPQIVLATARWSCQTQIKGRVLHVVSRMGAPLCEVIEVEPPAPAGGAVRR